MSNLAHRLEFVRRGMNVRRYHQQTTIEVDTVGKHSCGVALMAFLIDPGVSRAAILAAITHDLGEWVAGDIPSPTKRMLSQEAKSELDAIEQDALDKHDLGGFHLSPDEEKLLKLADYLDGLAFCTEELNRGNRSMQAVAVKYISYIPEYLDTVEELRWATNAKTVFTLLQIKYKDLTNGR